jgi:hypothetical protein
VVTGVGRGLGLVEPGVGIRVPSVGGAGAGVGLSGVTEGLTLGLIVTAGSSSSPPQAVSTPRASATVAAAAPTREVVVSSVRVVVAMSGAYARPDDGRRSVEFDHLVARGDHPCVVLPTRWKTSACGRPRS